MRATLSFRSPASTLCPKRQPLEFPTYDAPSSIGALAGETTVLSHSYGVHHQTVLVAAQVVANNAFDGYLALDKKGIQPVLIPLEGILIGGNASSLSLVTVLFRVFLEFYPIVPSFQDWQFHNDKLPDSWPAVAPTEAAQAAQCVITRFPWALDSAHIAPTAQTSWFDDNGMSRYGTSVSPSIDDYCNLLWLRRDLHTPTFDAFWFALVPKPVVATATTTATIVYSVHVLVDNQPLFPTFYHDIQVPHLRGAAREFLFARFAQAVRIRVKTFVTARKRRLIARFVVDGMKEEVIREELSGDALFKAYGGGRTRSASPTKRKRGEKELPSSVPGQEEEWPPRIVDSDLDEDEERRGRKRGQKRRRAWEEDLG